MFDAEWSDYGLKRLFNPQNWEFLPLEDQLKRYKQRDLQKSKAFGTARRIWGPSKIRKRVFVAPLMLDMEEKEVNVLSSPLKPRKGDNMLPEEPRILSEPERKELHEKELNVKMTDYKAWLRSRMQLREGLESMGLEEKWLQGKPDLTVLEQRVLERIIKRKLHKLEKNKELEQTSPLKKDNGRNITNVMVPDSPQPDLVYDLPEAVRVITQHLAERRLRAVDLFSQADKDKSWTINRKEFNNCIKEAGIPISDVLLDELVDTLDEDGNEVIDFREFVHGIKSFKLGERKRGDTAKYRHDQIRVNSPSMVPGSSKQPIQSERQSRVASAISGTSQYSSSSMSDSSYLSVPTIDITERRKLTPDDMIDKRKRERHSAKGRSRKKDVDKIKTGNPFVDNHSLRSTLGEDTGQVIDHFREERLKDYYKLCKLCKEREIQLTPNLLERALLYPGDKPHRRIRSRITIPGAGLLSSHFADPPAPPENPDDHLDFEKVFYNREGEPVMEIKHSFPKAEDVKPNVELQNLSTGKAIVRPKVNSWLTYEDYVKLTSHLGKRYVKLRDKHKKSHPFWPGHLLDKLQLCMDDRSQLLTDSLYRTKEPQTLMYHGRHNDQNRWPISDAGYMNPGNIESRKCYSIDWK